MSFETGALFVLCYANASAILGELERMFSGWQPWAIRWPDFCRDQSSYAALHARRETPSGVFSFPGGDAVMQFENPTKIKLTAVRLTLDERAYLDQKAERFGKSVSDVLRDALRLQRVVDREVLRAEAEV